MGDITRRALAGADLMTAPFAMRAWGQDEGPQKPADEKVRAQRLDFDFQKHHSAHFPKASPRPRPMPRPSSPSSTFPSARSPSAATPWTSAKSNRDPAQNPQYVADVVAIGVRPNKLAGIWTTLGGREQPGGELALKPARSQRRSHFGVYVYGLKQVLLWDVLVGGVGGVNAAGAD